MLNAQPVLTCGDCGVLIAPPTPCHVMVTYKCTSLLLIVLLITLHYHNIYARRVAVSTLGRPNV